MVSKTFTTVLRTKSLIGGMFGLFCVSLLVGCIDKDTDLHVIDGGTTVAPYPFNFSTTESVQLSVDYDVPEGYKVLFEVYAENPFVENKEGQMVKRTDLEPIIVRMTDENGVYKASEVIAAEHGTEVYIYTSYIGVPTLYKAAVQGGQIVAKIDWQSIEMSAPSTRAVSYTAPKDYHVLGTWDAATGRPNYLDSEGTLLLSTNILNTINQTLVEKGTCAEEYRQSVDFTLNDPEGRDSEVKVRFIGGTSDAYSAFGYYCYTDEEKLNTLADNRKCIVFPNTKTGKGITGGECVKLHYIDKNGVDRGTTFPGGVKIGWFLCNDAFRKGGVGHKELYSTVRLNDDGRTHTAAFRINDFIVLAFEDWEDADYNDVMFNIWSNPIEALLPDVPEVKPIEPGTDVSVAYSMTYKGIVAFEDNWPSRGDYDLNDVVMKYHSIIQFNTKNQVLTTEDTFTALWSGANYDNGFAYQLNTERSNVTCEILEGASEWEHQGLDTDLDKATISLFSSARSVTVGNTQTPVYKIRNRFQAPVDHTLLGTAPYNPFIFVHENMDMNRVEVHLPNYQPTEKANKDLFGIRLDLSNPSKGIYYVSTEHYPFAIHLSNADVYSTIEMKSVDQSYPKFADWVSSNGETNKDWYK